MRLAVIFIIISIFTTDAQAYIGPGLGAGTVGVVLGIIVSVFLALLALIYYPIKRMLKKKEKISKNKKEAENIGEDAE